MSGNKEDVSVKIADKSDAESILILQKEAYASEAALYGKWDIEPLRQTLEGLIAEWDEQVVLKAVLGETVAGSIRGRLQGETCCVGKLMVKPELQNKGLGKMLLYALENSFPKVRRFELFTGEKSLKNLHLYEQMGYCRERTQEIDAMLKIVFLVKYQTPKLEG
ncbi:GNAT family N-acetyltransferase [Anaeroarcus burkinensis]|uniref:GNAT family N-acetyltransferase n=1 Tax=Anaeroarcus burkinensis TaxID=82376 RepID=UPI0003F81956|nr:GNAT family N-acetyltransferase [Anaeroarcus burkinensis]